ncbi:MAG: hypothetical protein HY594_02920 [Candidatus Omnitrophica bacterium]|nr:hypothetical protein [Candidatus Omnitrophota bacterium]
MSVSASIRRGIQDTRRLLWVIAAWWLLHAFISILGQGVLSALSPKPNSLGSALLTGAVFLAAFSVYSSLWILIYGGMLGHLKRSDASTVLSWGEFIRDGRRWFWPLAIAASVLWALLLGLSLLFAAAGGLAVAVAPWAGLIHAVVMVIVLAGAVILLMYVPISLVQDDLGPLKALKASVGFARNHFGKTLQIILITAVLGVAFSVVVMGILFSTGQLPQRPGQQLPLWTTVLMDAFSAYLMVFLTASLFALYRESRPSSPAL